MHVQRLNSPVGHQGLQRTSVRSILKPLFPQNILKSRRRAIARPSGAAKDDESPQSKMGNRQDKHRRMLRVLPTTSAAALARLHLTEMKKADEVVIQAVGAQGACVALCAISQVRGACQRLYNFDLALKPLMLVGDPPGAKQPKRNTKKRSGRGKASGKLAERFLIFVRRIPLHPMMTAASEPARCTRDSLAALEASGLGKDVFTLASTLVHRLTGQGSDGSQHASGQMEEHKPERQAGGCLTKVTAANAEAVLFALQGICLARGRLWKMPDGGNDLLLFVEAPPVPLGPTERMVDEQIGKTGHGEGGKGGARLSQPCISLAAWRCGKWDWKCALESGAQGSHSVETQDSYVLPLDEEDEDMYIHPW